jgi:hypothetical protein
MRAFTLELVTVEVISTVAGYRRRHGGGGVADCVLCGF